jgi:hypothetical protein
VTIVCATANTFVAVVVITVEPVVMVRVVTAVATDGAAALLVGTTASNFKAGVEAPLLLVPGPVGAAPEERLGLGPLLLLVPGPVGAAPEERLGLGPLLLLVPGPVGAAPEERLGLGPLEGATVGGLAPVAPLAPPV